MSEVTRVVVDAMGGDYAPEWIIRGAVEAINEGAKAQVILTGKEDVIKRNLQIYLRSVKDRGCKCNRGDHLS